MQQLQADLPAKCRPEVFYQDTGLPPSEASAISGPSGSRGFHHTRKARDNTTKVLTLIHAACQSQTPCVFLGIDAKKAPDLVNWQFMFVVLSHIGLGDIMLRWIMSI